MKCPKCGYNSFDHLDSCKKCSQDLAAFKAKFGLHSLLFATAAGQAADTALATPLDAPSVATATAALPAPAMAPQESFGGAAPEGDPADFGYDFLADEEPQDSSAPFGHDVEEPAVATDGLNLAAEGDDFDLDSDWGASPAPTAAAAEPTLEDEDPFDFDAPANQAVSLETAPAPDLTPAEDPLAEFSSDFDFTDEPAAAPQETLGGEDFVFDEETPPTEKPKAKETPSDPFADRESAAADWTPGIPDITLAEEELSAAPDEPEVAASAVASAVAATAGLGGVAAAAETLLKPAPEPILEDEDETDQGDAEGPEEELPAALLAPSGSLFLRLGACALDLILLGLIYALFLTAGKLVLFPAGQGPQPSLAQAVLDLAAPYFLVFFTLGFSYFTLFHFFLGQTPGKMVFSLKVERASGEPVGLSHAFLRSVGGLISLLTAGLGFAVAFFDPDRRGLNDRLAGTRVADAAGGPPLAQDEL